MHTLYTLLGVERDASQVEIRRAYRRLLVVAHPDKGGDPEHFQQLKAAFTQLSDAGERLIYDEKLERICYAGAGGPGVAPPLGQFAGVQAWCRQGNGVVAVVHGQTQGRPQQQQSHMPCTASSKPASAGSDGNDEVLRATAAFRALAAGGSSSSSSSSLAAAHLARAQLHMAAGQLHHAIFDAEEAAQLHPEQAAAAALVAELRQRLERSQQAAQEPAPSPLASADSCDSDDEVLDGCTDWESP
ncbi:DnaJ [Chlorella vulgaris]